MATSPNQLRAAIEPALLYDGPSVIEVPIGEVPSPWDFVLMPRLRGG